MPGARYVTRERVEAMLDYEFLQCNLTLRTQRGDKTAFFAFADTLTTKVWLSSSHRWLEVYNILLPVWHGAPLPSHNRQNHHLGAVLLLVQPSLRVCSN